MCILLVYQTNLDLLFLLDESGSVGSTNHQLGLDFMESVVGFLISQQMALELPRSHFHLVLI